MLLSQYWSLKVTMAKVSILFKVCYTDIIMNPTYGIVLFVRMGITTVMAASYMAYKKIDGFPLGPKEVRPLLLLRGFSGFFGVFGMYYSLMYLPLADATVITFLSPVIACAVCAYLLKQPFTRLEQIASGISLLGVILIARPTTIFAVIEASEPQATDPTTAPIPMPNGTWVSDPSKNTHVITPHAKLIAVGVALIGALGGASVITTLRWIGQRAHPLITVNYFAAWVVVVSGVLSALIPSIGFALPTTLNEWGMLIFLGLCGFTAVSFRSSVLSFHY
jgi:drug/metabolite transporter (DMT)-like permease